jgi:hypothetical protein
LRISDTINQGAKERRSVIRRETGDRAKEAFAKGKASGQKENEKGKDTGNDVRL